MQGKSWLSCGTVAQSLTSDALWSLCAECSDGDASTCGIKCFEPEVRACEDGNCTCKCPNPGELVYCDETGCSCTSDDPGVAAELSASSVWLQQTSTQLACCRPHYARLHFFVDMICVPRSSYVSTLPTSELLHHDEAVPQSRTIAACLLPAVLPAMICLHAFSSAVTMLATFR